MYSRDGSGAGKQSLALKQGTIPVARFGVGSASASMDQMTGLPPVAILAGSRGGRLVVSGVTIAGDRGGGGFNITAARAAAKEGVRLAAVKEGLSPGKARGDGRSGRNTQVGYSDEARRGT